MQTPLSIDMVNPTEACSQLGIGAAELIRWVNHNRLPAYNMGGAIRFKMIDVLALGGVVSAA